MLTALSTGRVCASSVVLLLLAGAGGLAVAQEDQSGASAGLAIESSGLDDALYPIDVGARPGSDLVDVRDTAAEREPVDTPLALWEQLANLTLDERANAHIELELGSAASNADHEAATSIAALWNRGNYELALAQLRKLEEAAAPLGLGIAWKVPRALSGSRGLDRRIGGTRDKAQTMNLDYDAESGNLFTAVRWGSTTGDSAWSISISVDSGLTWSESYSFSSSVGMIDVDCAVSDDYVYVAYVAGNTTDEARIRRCLVSTGGIDGSYGYQLVFDAGANAVEEVALASNADDFDNRIYYAIIQDNDVLRWAYDAADDGTTFVEDSPAGSNPEFGLDMTWDNNRDNCAEFIYVSYTGNDGNIHVLGHSETGWTDWTIETGAGSFRTTAISAYEDAIMCAFEYPYSNGTGIRYGISYDCGASWSPGTLAVPDGSSVFGYFEPDVDARNGAGTAIIYQAEAGEFDPMYYRTRAGFAPGAWSDPTIFNDYDVYTGSDTAIGYLPPLAGELFSHGAMYLSLDPDFRTIYFDRPGSAGASCGDTTPPVVSIDSPAALECACGSIDITGSVDDPDGTYVRDRLETRRSGTSSWVDVATAFGARSGVLYNWDTSLLTQDFYDVRIVAENECGLSESDSTLVYNPTEFDSLKVSTPENGRVYGGWVCFHGTAWTQSCFADYTVSYRPAGGGTWWPVDPHTAVYTSPIIEGRLASWSTVEMGLADGEYELRVVGETECGNAATTSLTVTVDNTAPVARLTAPENCEVFAPGASIEIHGEVFDNNLDTWTLAVTGGPYDDWHVIAGPTMLNASGLLATWDTAGLPACAYTIRLQASDAAVLDCGSSSHVVEAYRSIMLGGLASADLDNDGDVDLIDFALFLLEFHGPTP